MLPKTPDKFFPRKHVVSFRTNNANRQETVLWIHIGRLKPYFLFSYNRTFLQRISRTFENSTQQVLYVALFFFFFRRN